MSSRRRRSSRCWTVVGPARALDIEVLARDDERLGTVLAQLGPLLGTRPPSAFSGITRLPDDVTLDDVRLRHGAVLGIGRPADDSGVRAAPGALELRVVGGADAGRTFALDSGSHVVGRGDDAVVGLADPNVSRRHVVVHVAGGTVEG